MLRVGFPSCPFTISLNHPLVVAGDMMRASAHIQFLEGLTNDYEDASSAVL